MDKVVKKSHYFSSSGGVTSPNLDPNSKDGRVVNFLTKLLLALKKIKNKIKADKNRILLIKRWHQRDQKTCQNTKIK